MNRESTVVNRESVVNPGFNDLSWVGRAKETEGRIIMRPEDTLNRESSGHHFFFRDWNLPERLCGPFLPREYDDRPGERPSVTSMRTILPLNSKP